MTAIQRAPWSLRAYAALLLAVAVLFALAEGGSQNWTRVAWAGVWGILACTGSRPIWWLPVAGNVLATFVVPLLVSGVPWIAIPLGLVALALLLAPESRRYVFGRDPESEEAADG